MPFYPRNSKADTILVLGILSCVLLGPISGIPAWLMGRAELRHMKIGITDPFDRKYVRTGMVLGIVGSIISLVWLAWELFVAG